MSTKLVNLISAGQLVRVKNGAFIPVDNSAIQNKLLGVYFSGGWCPPCQAFNPKLKKYYEELKQRNEKFELVFISSDKTEADQIETMTTMHGDWLTLKLNDKTTSTIKERVDSQTLGIPTLVICGPCGHMYTTNGKIDVLEADEKDAFEKWTEFRCIES
eukprot:CFRG1450T1